MYTVNDAALKQALTGIHVDPADLAGSELKGPCSNFIRGSRQSQTTDTPLR